MDKQLTEKVNSHETRLALYLLSLASISALNEVWIALFCASVRVAVLRVASRCHSTRVGAKFALRTDFSTARRRKVKLASASINERQTPNRLTSQKWPSSGPNADFSPKELSAAITDVDFPSHNLSEDIAIKTINIAWASGIIEIISSTYCSLSLSSFPSSAMIYINHLLPQRRASWEGVFVEYSRIANFGHDKYQ